MNYETITLVETQQNVLNQETVNTFFEDMEGNRSMNAPHEFNVFGDVNIEEKQITWIAFGNFSISSLQKIIEKVDATSKVILATGVDYEDAQLPSIDERALIEQWVSNDLLEIVYCSNEKDCAREVEGLIDRLKYDGWRPLLDTEALKSDTQRIEGFYSYLGELLNKDKVLDNTRDKNMRVYLENSLVNLPVVLATKKLSEMVKNYDYRPVLLVGAGPSLIKQLPTLHKYKHLFTIIAATATYPNLQKHGIEPDYLIAVDPTNKSVWDEGTSSKLILDVGCDPATVWSAPEKTTLCAHAPMVVDLLDKIGIDIDLLPTGGSVATSAYKVARLLGSNPIVMIGQDLAYSNGQKRTEGYAFDAAVRINQKSEKPTFSIDAYGGQGKVETDGALLLFKTWFENEFSLAPDITIFNCTEGGADIEGSAPVPFEMVCEELNKFSLTKKDWDLEAKPISEELLVVKNGVKQFIEDVKAFKLLARKGVKLAEKMRDGKKAVDFSKLDRINHELKEVQVHVKNFCDSYASVVMREVQRKVVREEDVEEKKAVSFYMNIYYVAEQSAKSASSFLEKLERNLTLLIEAKDDNKGKSIDKYVSSFSNLI